MESKRFINASEAFEHLYRKLVEDGARLPITRTMFNVGFYIDNPLDNHIKSDFRKWNLKYANREWDWYESKNPNGEEISKFAPIWKNHMDESGNVRSNYGWQWSRSSQLEKVINKLKSNKLCRQAVLSMYDGKEIDTYRYDTPCTNTIHFQVVDNKLCMSVNMRSNDIWFGFCNDQYCFSKLQEKVSEEIGLEVGWYYHFSSNMHVYENNILK